MRTDKLKNIAKVAKVAECSCKANREQVINKTTKQHIEIVESSWRIILACNKIISSRLNKMKIKDIREYMETMKVIVWDTSQKNISKRLRFLILKRDDFTCKYCWRKAPNVILHIDHVKPYSKWWLTEEKNLVTSCADCNLWKSNLYSE